MTERMVREAHWGYIALPLKSGELAEKGKLACIDTGDGGKIVKGRTAAGLIPFGVFQETLTGDGTKTVKIRLFAEIRALWWNNDSGGTPVTAADVGTIAAIVDDQTVSADDTGRSAAGLVLAVDAAKGVLVYAALPFA